MKVSKKVASGQNTYRYVLFENMLYRVYYTEDGLYCSGIEVNECKTHHIKLEWNGRYPEDGAHLEHVTTPHGDKPKEWEWGLESDGDETEIDETPQPIYTGFQVAIELINIGRKYWLDRIKEFAGCEEAKTNQDVILAAVASQDAK